MVTKEMWAVPSEAEEELVNTLRSPGKAEPGKCIWEPPLEKVTCPQLGSKETPQQSGPQVTGLGGGGAETTQKHLRGT